jgi:hypothetical protein
MTDRSRASKCRTDAGGPPGRVDRPHPAGDSTGRATIRYCWASRKKITRYQHGSTAPLLPMSDRRQPTVSPGDKPPERGSVEKTSATREGAAMGYRLHA